MSYDLGLYRDGVPVQVDHFDEGGTRILGGTDQAELNITYNYSWFFYKFLSPRKGLRWLYGKTGKQCIGRLEKAVKELGTQQFENYWAPTPGNAGHALSILLRWAKQHPDAVFNGD